jgi:hypothetical protein
VNGEPVNPRTHARLVPPPQPGGRQPLLWAALAYAVGLSTGVYQWCPPLWWLVAWIVLAASGAYFLRRRVRAAFALGLCTLFIAGALTIQVRASRDPGGSGILQFADGQEVLVTGHVAAEGTLREEGSGDPGKGWRRNRTDCDREPDLRNPFRSPCQFLRQGRKEWARGRDRRHFRTSLPLRPAVAVSCQTLSTTQFPQPWRV